MPTTQNLKDVNGRVILDMIGKRFSVEHKDVIDAEIDMATQRATLVEKVIGKSWAISLIARKISAT